MHHAGTPLRTEFPVFWEFLGGIPRGVKFLGISGNWIWGNFNILRSTEILRNSQYLKCEGFKKRSNFRGVKPWVNKRYAIQNLPRDIHTCIRL